MIKGKTYIRKKAVILVLFISGFVFYSQSYSKNTAEGDLTVVIKGAESDQGKVLIALSTNAADFKSKDNAFKVGSVSISEGKAKHIFKNISTGEYAIKVFHDENSNGELDTNFLGIPREKYGFSNNPEVFGLPSFEKVRFDFKSSTTIEIILK